MPRWPSKTGPNKGKKWSAEHRRKYMATIRAKKVEGVSKDATTLGGLPVFTPAFTDALDAQIERLQKVRDLLR